MASVTALTIRPVKRSLTINKQLRLGVTRILSFRFWPANGPSGQKRQERPEKHARGRGAGTGREGPHTPAGHGKQPPSSVTSKRGVQPSPKIIFSRLFLDFETKSISQHQVEHPIVSAMHELVGVAALGKHGMYAWLIPTRYGLGTDAAKAKGEALLPSERADPLV